jgi:hypothetical protein
MSDYWDAVSRVARGAPGSAAPRQRSVFEGGGMVEQVDELDVTASDATPATESAPAPDVAQQIGLPATITTSKAERTETASSPLVPAQQSSTPAEIRLVERARDVEQHPPAGTPERMTSPAPLEVATRVEVQRIESERTLRVVESRPPEIAFVEPPPAPGASAVPTVMLAPVPAQPVKVDESPPAAVEPSVVVVAEPVAVPPADRPLPAPEPPLVIEIGRIDIRIESATPPPPGQPRRSEVKPVHSLDDFLMRRGAGP